MSISDFIKDRNFAPELVLTATRSRGPGGQHVNKVNTRVELRFNIGLSEVLTGEEKAMIREKLAGRINSNDELIIVSQSEKSQLRNREKTIAKFYILLDRALFQQKERVRTRPTQASVIKRLEWKRKHSEKKDGRRLLE